MIATGVGGIPEMLPADMLVPPRQPQALANALKSRLESLDRAREKARDLALDFRRRFDVARMCEEVTAFYREAVA